MQEEMHVYCCRQCGWIYESASDSGYCPGCEKIIIRSLKQKPHSSSKQSVERQSEYKARAGNSLGGISQVAKLARDAGMSYGEYVAKHGGRYK